MSILLDAGPSLNFLAVGQQNILIQAAKAQDLQLAAPERVDLEVEGMTKNSRFHRTPVLNTWRTLKSSRRLVILDDTLSADGTDPLSRAVTRISGRPAKARVRTGKDLGEIMVLAHASVYAQQGERVFVLMDEKDGRNKAKTEQGWLLRQGAPGALSLWSTPMVLREAGRRNGWIAKGLAWEQVYDQMRRFDDGLPALQPRK